MYKNYTFLNIDRLALFGGNRSTANFAGAFYLHMDTSSADSSVTIGSRLIKFGD